MEQIDPLAVLTALGIQGARTVAPISEGWGDTQLWRVERESGPAVLRLFPPGAQRAAEREAIAQQAALAGGVPVPRVEARDSVDGRPALLLSWIPGRPLLATVEAQPELAPALGVRFGREQARIHSLAAPERLRDLGGDWIAWGADDDPELVERLESVAMRAALLHLDYHPLNVLVDGPQVSGVIDWANAAAGDARADVARTLTLLTLLSDSAPASPEVRRSHRGFVRGYLRGYRQLGDPLDKLDLFLVWAGGAMLRDLSPKLDQPGVWLRDHHLRSIRRLVDGRRARLGLAPLPE